MDNLFFLSLFFIMCGLSVGNEESSFTLNVYKKNTTVQELTYEKAHVNSVDALNISCNLKCPVDSCLSQTGSVLWTHEGFGDVSTIMVPNLKTTIEGDKSDKARQQDTFNDNTILSQLSFPKPTQEIIGKYKCSFTPKEDPSKLAVSGEIIINSAPVAHTMEPSETVNNGSLLNFTCSAEAWPPSQFDFKKGETFETSESVSIEKFNITSVPGNLTVGRIILSTASYNDKDWYWCVFTNEFGEDRVPVKIRVKDPLAALWPFIGILAEIIVVVVIIVLYEMKRKKIRAAKLASEKAQENDSTSRATTTADRSGGSSDVRQRGPVNA